MNTEFFIARKILSRDTANFSRPVVRIAIVSIALGLATMFVALAILTGFQKQVQEKVIGFGAHIQVSHFDENNSLETKPVSTRQEFYPSIQYEKGIRHIQVFATKAGIIKTPDDIQGVVLKGIGTDFDPSFFRGRIVGGRLLQLKDTGRSNEILISKNLSTLLRLKMNDEVRMYFISGTSTPARKFKIAGIYETGLEEFDRMYVMCDIRQIQKLNGWAPDEVGGFEITIDDFKDLDRIGKQVYHRIGMTLDAKTIRDLYPQIFDWLDLQDINLLIILVLLILVSGITMISTLLVFILERTRMIGILKAMGMANGGIRRIFIYNAIYVIGKGMLWGNVIGLVVCLLQQRFGIVTLPQESYYVSVVPINLSLPNILLLNAGTLAVCTAMLIIPSYIITKITPVTAIRFS